MEYLGVAVFALFHLGRVGRDIDGVTRRGVDGLHVLVFFVIFSLPSSCSRCSYRRSGRSRNRKRRISRRCRRSWQRRSCGGRVSSLWWHRIGIGQDRDRNPQRFVPEERQERVEVQTLDADEADAVLAQVAAHALGQRVDHHEFGRALDKDHSASKEELGARDIEVSFQLLTLAFLEGDTAREEGFDSGAGVDEAHEAIQVCNAREVGRVTGHEKLDRLLTVNGLDGLQILEQHGLELWVQMRLGLLDNQAAVGGVGILGQLAQHDRHVDQIVEAQPVLLDLKGVHHQRKPGL